MNVPGCRQNWLSHTVFPVTQPRHVSEIVRPVETKDGNLRWKEVSVYDTGEMTSVGSERLFGTPLWETPLSLRPRDPWAELLVPRSDPQVESSRDFIGRLTLSWSLGISFGGSTLGPLYFCLAAKFDDKTSPHNPSLSTDLVYDSRPI